MGRNYGESFPDFVLQFPGKVAARQLGKKEHIRRHRGNPSFFFFRVWGLYMVYTLLSGPMVYTLFPLFSRENGIHHSFFLLCDLEIGRQTEKIGVRQWWCILFFPLLNDFVWVWPEDYCKEDPCNFPWNGELARNWPRVGQLLSNSVYKILPWRFLAVFLLPRARTKSAWLEVDQELDVGCQVWHEHHIFRVEIAGVFLAVVLWQHPIRN